MKGKRWLLLTRWVNLTRGKKRQLNELFALNRRVMKAYLLKESLDRLWSYRYEGAMLRYLKSWIDQLRWQRLKPMEKLADMLLRHLEGILNYCRTKVPLGVVEAVNGNIKVAATPRTRLPQPELPAAESAAHGRHQDRIRRFPESRVKCGRYQIPAQNPKINLSSDINIERSCLPVPGHFPGRRLPRPNPQLRSPVGLMVLALFVCRG